MKKVNLESRIIQNVNATNQKISFFNKFTVLLNLNSTKNISKVEEMRVLFVNLCENVPYKHFPNNDEMHCVPNYNYFLSSTKKLRASSQDVSNFVSELSNYQTMRGFSSYAGWFLTAVINNSKDLNFSLDLYNNTKPIDFIGIRNQKKNITITGNTGRLTAFEQISGTIIVYGTVGSNSGDYQKGGSFRYNKIENNREIQVTRSFDKGSKDKYPRHIEEYLRSV